MALRKPADRLAPFSGAPHCYRNVKIPQGDN
jgi:hypothetical protein